MDDGSSTNLNYTRTNENLTSTTPLGKERFTSSIYGETQCPTCWFIIATGINKYPLKLEQIASVAEEEWTTEKLIDELHLHLMRIKVEVSNGRGELFRIRKYEQQAEELIYRIPRCKPTPAFIIEESDLTYKLRKELAKSTPIVWRRRVLKQAAGRIFEEVDSDYYHLSVAKNLKVRLV